MSIDYVTGRNIPSQPEIEPLVYVDAVYDAFRIAAYHAKEGSDRRYHIAGVNIRLCCASPVLLAALAPALAHVASHHADQAALTIYAWDSASTNVALPPFPWRLVDYGARGDIRGFTNERVSITYLPGVDILSIVDIEHGRALYWIADARAVPTQEQAAPFRAILNTWLSKQGIQLTHAAAVGKAQGALLLAGKGGSGKSTTALACLRAGWWYLGDDYVAVQAEPTPYVWSLYASGKLDRAALARLPQFSMAVSNPERSDNEKALVFLQSAYGTSIRAGLPIRAIVLPQVTHRRETVLRRTTAMAGLAALAPSTIFQVPVTGGGALKTLANTVRQVPSYVLELGTDLAALTHVLGELLEVAA